MTQTNRLRAKLFELTNEFASEVLEAIASTSLDEILDGSVTGTRASARARTMAVARRVSPGKRRTPNDFEQTIEAIVSMLKNHGGGLRAEELRARLGLERRDMHGPIAKALASRRIRKTGEKRTTTYFVR